MNIELYIITIVLLRTKDNNYGWRAKMALNIRQLNTMWKSDIFSGNKLQRKLGKVKIAAEEIQDEITDALINSLADIRKEQGAKEALRVAELFQKVTTLYADGVTMASAAMVITELNNDKKNFVKIAGFAALCLSSLLPHVLVDKDQFDDFIEELKEDAKRETNRKTAKVTRLKPRVTKTKRSKSV